MNFRKNIFVFFIIFSILFCIASVSASDINENLTAIDDDQQPILEEINEEKLTIQESDETTLNANENDNAISKEIATEEQVLTKSTSYDNVLSAKNDLKTLKITFTKQTGKYTYNKKVYFKITDEDTGKAVNNAQIYYKVYNSKGGLETYGYAEPNSNGVGCIKFTDGKIHIGTFKIKATLYWWDDQYGDEAYIYGDTIKNVKIYKNAKKDKTTKGKLIVSAPKVTNSYNKAGTFKVKIINDITKNPVKGIKLKIKVYTGKKYKTYSVKTNKKGIGKINIKKLSEGKHKVVVTAKATKKYKSKTVKSSITIKKASTKTTTNSKSTSKNGNGKINTFIEGNGHVEQKHYSKDTILYYNGAGMPIKATTHYYYPVVSFSPFLANIKQQ